MLRQRQATQALELDTSKGRVSGLGVLWRDASQGESNPAGRAFRRGDFAFFLESPERETERQDAVFGWDHLEGSSFWGADSDKALGTFNLPEGYGIREGEQGLEFEAQIVPWPPVTDQAKERIAKIEGGLIRKDSIGWSYAAVEIRGETSTGEPIIGGQVDVLYDISAAVWVVENDLPAMSMQTTEPTPSIEPGVKVLWNDGSLRSGAVLRRDASQAVILRADGTEITVQQSDLVVIDRLPTIGEPTPPAPAGIDPALWQPLIDELQSPQRNPGALWASVIATMRT